MNFLFIKESGKNWIHNIRDSSPKNENSVINYSPLCRSNPIRPSFIFITQIKIFVMKSESFLTIHRKQCNWNVPRPRNAVRTSLVIHCLWSYEKTWMWFEGEELLNKVVIFVFFAHKKYSHSFIKLQLNHWCHMDYFTDALTTVCFWTLNISVTHCCLWRVRKF